MVAGILAPRIYLIAKYRESLIESDEAVVGLMARHIFQGEFPVFYWGQHYLGSIEAFFAAGLFAVFDATPIVLKLAPFLLFAAFLIVHYYLGRSTIGHQSALLATVLVGISPAFLTIWSLKARGGYMALLLVGTLSLAIAAKQLKCGYSPKWMILLGLCLGLAFWTHLLAVVYLIPIVAILLIKDEKCFVRSSAIPLAGGFLIGSSPFWLYNATRSWPSFTLKGVRPTDVALDFLHFFETGIPILSGARPNWADKDLFPFLGMALVAVLFGSILFLVWKWCKNVRPSELEGKHLLLAVGLLFPFLFSASGFAWFVNEPRYLIPLYSVIYLLLMSALNKRSIQLSLFASLLVLHLAGSFRATNEEFTGYTNVESNKELLNFLTDHEVNRVCAPYWIAYRLTFESGEKIICTPPPEDETRYQPYADRVNSSPSRAYIRLAAPRYSFVRQLITPPGHYVPIRIGNHEVFLPPPAE